MKDVENKGNSSLFAGKLNAKQYREPTRVAKWYIVIPEIQTWVNFGVTWNAKLVYFTVCWHMYFTVSWYVHIMAIW
jgi:hypothetical protein